MWFLVYRLEGGTRLSPNLHPWLSTISPWKSLTSFFSIKFLKSDSICSNNNRFPGMTKLFRLLSLLLGPPTPVTKCIFSKEPCQASLVRTLSQVYDEVGLEPSSWCPTTWPVFSRNYFKMIFPECPSPGMPSFSTFLSTCPTSVLHLCIPAPPRHSQG